MSKSHPPEVAPRDLPWIAQAVGQPDAQLWHLSYKMMPALQAFNAEQVRRGELWHYEDYLNIVVASMNTVYAIDAGGRSGCWIVDTSERRIYDELPADLGATLLEQGRRMMPGDDDETAYAAACADNVHVVVQFGLSPGQLKKNGGEAVLQPVKRAHGPSEVAVIRLRAVNYASTHGTRDVSWSHRWVVHAHLRRLQSGVLTMVHEHVKGPKDRPLVNKPQVRSVTR